MESSPLLVVSSPTILISAILALFICFIYITSLVPRRGDGGKDRAGGAAKTAPEAGGSWPLLGHLLLLDGPLPAHLVLSKMADKLGPIFTVRLGLRKAVVVNTWEVAKECLTTNDRAFATRPKTVAFDVLTYNYAMVGFSPYSPYWRHMRKISTIELLSSHRMELNRHVRELEVLTSVRDIQEQYRRKESTGAPLLVDMKRWFADITVNIMFRMIVGRRYNDSGEGAEEGRKALRDWIEWSGRFVLSDGLPFLRWLDLGGHEKAMKKTAKELDRVMQQWLDEHKAQRKSGEVQSRDQDFMDILLSILGDADIHSYDSDTINKATCLAMILAGTDTTTVTMTWAISLLLNNKDALRKAQHELDTRIGRDRRVNESDLNNLPYLRAVIKETMRLYPAVPLSIPHEAGEDCNVSGYSVPKGTQLVLNIYKIQRDPRVWPDPSEFRPERFLTTHKDVDVRGHNFELIPFSSGRRICAGISLALQVTGLALGSFLHVFNVQSQDDKAIDMEEAIGLTNLKASPLDVLVSPRLPENVYQ